MATKCPPSDDDNWILATTGLKYLKKGLEVFTDETLKEQHCEFVQALCPQTEQCTQCDIGNIQPCHTKACRRHNCFCKDKKKRRLCPNEQCSQLHDCIVAAHRSKDPLWANTDPHKWYSNHISIGTCFINTPGYKLKRSITEIDCSGMLNIIINNAYFRTKLGLNDDGASTNDFKEAREARNAILHEPNQQLLFGKMQHYVSLFIKVLETPVIHQTPVAQTALEKLKEIKNGNYSPSKPEANEVLMTEENSPLQCSASTLLAIKKAEEAKEEKDHAIHVAKIDERTDRKIEAAERRLKRDMKSAASTAGGSLTHWRREKNLKSDLIAFYRHEYNTLSISPLFRENEASLVHLYATPSLYKVTEKSVKSEVNSSGNYGKGTNRVVEIDRSRTPILSVMDLFFKAGKLNHHIYLTADAGYGKTSFSKRLLIDWCQAHSPLKVDKIHYEKSEIATMKMFDFVFFVPLNKHNEIEHVDEMLHDEIERSLQRRYSLKFLEDTLRTKTCLIILDGLDEWTPPRSAYYFEIPESKFRENCSILATSRNWKFSIISPRYSPLHVELSGIDETESRCLVDGAIKHLNGKNETSKNPSLFYTDITKHILNDIMHVPLLLMQSLCLWYDGISVGKPRCKMYYNIIELLLRKNERRLAQNVRASLSRMETPLPFWFYENQHCCRQYSYLLAIGKLAFYTLFGKHLTSFVFDKTVAETYITDDELDFGVNVGLLSMEKSYGNHSSRTYALSFISKTYQEVLASLYIAAQNEKPDCTFVFIQRYCSSVENVLEMSNVFRILCGLCPSLFEKLSEMFIQVMSKYNRSLDVTTCQDTLVSYQEMTLQCHEEAQASDMKHYDFRLTDVVLCEGIQEEDLQRLERTDKSSVISLHLTTGNNRSFDQQVVNEVLRASNNLQHLVLQGSYQWLNLGPSNEKYYEFLSSKSIELTEQSFLNSTQLKQLYLQDIAISDLSVSKSTGLRILQLVRLQIENLDLTPFVQLEQLFLRELSLCYLNVCSCTHLTNIHMCQLQISQLDLTYCQQLQELRLESLSEIQQLNLSACQLIQQVHLKSLKQLEQLSVSHCKHLQILHILLVPNMAELDVSACTYLDNIYLDSLHSLNEIDVSTCTQLRYLHLESLHDLNQLTPPANAKLNELTLASIRNIKQLKAPQLKKLCLKSIEDIELLDLLKICDLQVLRLESIRNKLRLEPSCLVRLQVLQLKSLTLLKHLDISGCVQLKELHLMFLDNVKRLDLSACSLLQQLYLQALDLISLDISGCLMLDQIYLESLSNIKIINVRSRTRLQQIYKENVRNIKQLDLSTFLQIRRLHLKFLTNISRLDIFTCVQLQELHLCCMNIPLIDMSKCIHLQILQLASLYSINKVDLRHNGKLILLNLESLRNVEEINMPAFSQLQQVHVTGLDNLKQLDVSTCAHLQQLYVKSLSNVIHLDLTACTKLQKLHIESLKNIQDVVLPALTQLRSVNIESLGNLRKVDLTSCKNLQQIDLKYIGNIKDINLANCTQLQILHLDTLNSLQQIDMSGCVRLHKLNIVSILNTTLDLSFCEQLEQIHVKSCQNLKLLEISSCSNLQLLHLESLGDQAEVDISVCKQLQVLHFEFLRTSKQIDLSMCSYLHELYLMSVENVAEFNLTACAQLQQLQLGFLNCIEQLDLSSCQQLRKLSITALANLSELDVSNCAQLRQIYIKSIGKTQTINLAACKHLQQLHLESIFCVEHLDLCACVNLQQVHLQSLWKIRKLDFSACEELQHLAINHLKYMNEIELSNCTELQQMHLQSLNNLEYLDLSACKQLKELELGFLWNVKQLDLSACTELRQLYLESLESIKHINLSNCKQLQVLHIEMLNNIEQLDMAASVSLRQLHIHFLVNLKHIELSACKYLKQIDLQCLGKITQLDLAACTGLLQLHIESLDEVKQLNLSTCKQLSQLHLKCLKSFTQPDLSSCTQLKHVLFENLPISKPNLSHCLQLDDDNVIWKPFQHSNV